MDDIIKLYNEQLTTSFPHRQGDDVMRIDLVLIDSHTAGLVRKHIGFRGYLSADDIKTNGANG